MTEDLSVFWQNNARAQELFADLLARAERGAYDDEFLKQLAAYREELPESERADIFAAQYLLHHGDAESAVVCGERAFQRRPGNAAVWKVLAKAYKACGRTLDFMMMEGYLHGAHPDEPLTFPVTEELSAEHLGRLSLALGSGDYAPIARNRAHFAENNQLLFCDDIFVGEPLRLTKPEDGSRFWIGCYAYTGFLSDASYMIDDVRQKEWFLSTGHRNFSFDFQKAQELCIATRIEVPKGREVIVPVAGTEPGQELCIETASLERWAYLGKWAFSYFRLHESATLTPEGDAPYVVGTPVLLGHSPHRKKLVFNILVDALSWAVVRSHFPSCMPRIAAFFSRGVIFNQHFSTSEYTYPALPAIETGCYPHHIQVFNEQDSHELPADFLTLSECMKDLGYYCVAPMSGGGSMYSGAMRGYDRIIVTSWELPCFTAVERVMRQIEAFRETDQFLFIHVVDVHPWDAMGFRFAPEVETHIALSERFFKWERATTSVHLPDFELYKQHFWAELRHLDYSIGTLLSYIEERYSDEEYIINLYSDHGNSIFTPRPQNEDLDVLGENSTSAAWMIRGAGVPQGVVTDELTSITDIYPTLGHLCGFPAAPNIDGNLPAVFGGHARDAVYSMSFYPGYTYKLAVRNQTHALRLETREVVDEDGTVDFAGAKVGIYPRTHELEAGYEIDNEDLRAFFYPRARDFVRSIANNGEFWPAMRAARPSWFGEKEGQI